MAKLWANFWNGDTSSVVSRKDIDDITVTSVTKNDNTTTNMTENASSSGGGSSDGGGSGGEVRGRYCSLFPLSQALRVLGGNIQ